MGGDGREGRVGGLDGWGLDGFRWDDVRSIDLMLSQGDCGRSLVWLGFVCGVLLRLQRRRAIRLSNCAHS